MTSVDRTSVTVGIVEALSKLQAMRLSDTRVQTILRRALGEGSEKVLEKAGMGGPGVGFLNDGPSLLSAIEQKWKIQKPFYTIQPIADPEGLVVKSIFEELGSTTISTADMEQWSKEAVFCHNDLAPRNIMVQPGKGPDGETRYKLAAIIDWELAGFYPPSYQLSLQDTQLGVGNQRLEFYLLLKEGMKDMVPLSPSQVALVHAMKLIFESQHRWLWERSNIPANIRKRFREMLGLSRDKHPYLGWKCETGGGPLPEFSKDDSQKLEDEVVADMMARRQAKAKSAPVQSCLGRPLARVTRSDLGTE